MNLHPRKNKLLGTIKMTKAKPVLATRVSIDGLRNSEKGNVVIKRVIASAYGNNRPGKADAFKTANQFIKTGNVEPKLKPILKDATKLYNSLPANARSTVDSAYAATSGDVSHIESFANLDAKGLGARHRDASNIAGFEDASFNRSRGARTMTQYEIDNMKAKARHDSYKFVEETQGKAQADANNAYAKAQAEARAKAKAQAEAQTKATVPIETPKVKLMARIKAVLNQAINQSIVSGVITCVTNFLSKAIDILTNYVETDMSSQELGRAFRALAYESIDLGIQAAGVAFILVIIDALITMIPGINVIYTIVKAVFAGIALAGIVLLADDFAKRVVALIREYFTNDGPNGFKAHLTQLSELFCSTGIEPDTFIV